MNNVMLESEKRKERKIVQPPAQSLAKSSQNSWLPAQTIYHLTTCLLSYLPDVAQCLHRKSLNQIFILFYFFLCSF